MMKLKGSVVKFEDKYNQAIAACEIATLRLKCLNRKLAEDPEQVDSLSPKMRAKVKKYYDDHMQLCEGITLPVN